MAAHHLRRGKHCVNSSNRPGLVTCCAGRCTTVNREMTTDPPACTPTAPRSLTSCHVCGLTASGWRVARPPPRRSASVMSLLEPAVG